MTAAYHRLPNGAWGVRVREGAPGDIVRIEKRGGSICYATLGELAGSAGGCAVYGLRACGPSPGEQWIKRVSVP